MGKKELMFQLRNTVRELERLREVHLERYEGKIGEPDMDVILSAKDVMYHIELTS